MIIKKQNDEQQKDQYNITPTVPKKKSCMKWIVLILLVGLIGGGAYYFLELDKKADFIASHKVCLDGETLIECAEYHSQYKDVCVKALCEKSFITSPNSSMPYQTVRTI